MPQRQRGLDALRILAAFFVVGIHLFPQLADLEDSGAGLPQFANALGYALVFCAVNSFGLLSGYLGYREQGNTLRVSALIILWLQILFYRVCFLLLPSLAGLTAPVTKPDILLPISQRVNWYMSCYFELMFFAPAIHLLIRSLPKRGNAIACVLLFVIPVASMLPRSLVECDPFQLEKGYSWMWLGFLYFWGASIRKHGWGTGISGRRLCGILCTSLLLMALWRWTAQAFFPPQSFPRRMTRLLYDYLSPTVIASAVCLLLLFLRMQPPLRMQNTLEQAASAALGVFLLHTTVWYWLILPNRERLSLLPPAWAACNVLLAALGITLISIAVDLIRQRLFRLLRVRQFADAAQTLLFRVFSSMADKLISGR